MELSPSELLLTSVEQILHLKSWQKRDILQVYYGSNAEIAFIHRCLIDQLIGEEIWCPQSTKRRLNKRYNYSIFHLFSILNKTNGKKHLRTSMYQPFRLLDSFLNDVIDRSGGWVRKSSNKNQNSPTHLTMNTQQTICSFSLTQLFPLHKYSWLSMLMPNQQIALK